MNLTNLFLEKKYATDKYDLGYITDIYSDLFKDYTATPITFLEIGVQEGGSICMWRDYFHSDSIIYTLDIKPCEAIEGLPGVNQIVMDAYTKETVDLFNDDLFDIIIDDGPHTYFSMEYLIINYYSKLKPKGIMVIEDIIDLKWTPELQTVAKNIGYKHIEKIEMEGHQKTKEMLSLWEKGLDVLILKK